MTQNVGVQSVVLERGETIPFLFYFWPQIGGMLRPLTETTDEKSWWSVGKQARARERTLGSGQCDQMAIYFFQNLAIQNNEKLPKSIKYLPNEGHNFAKYQIVN